MSDCGVVAVCSSVGVGLRDAFCVGSVRVAPDHVSTRDIAVGHECYITDMRFEDSAASVRPSRASLGRRRLGRISWGASTAAYMSCVPESNGPREHLR